MWREYPRSLGRSQNSSGVAAIPMKRPYQSEYSVCIKFVLALAACALVAQAGQPQALEERIKCWDIAAMKEAGDQGRLDLVPELEKIVNASKDAASPVCQWGKAALAKLGVKRYLDETVTELTTTNSALFMVHIKGLLDIGVPEARAVQYAKFTTQGVAFKKLAYVCDLSTVKFIAAFLYSTEKPWEVTKDGDVDPVPLACLAAQTLHQMNLENAPPAKNVVLADPVAWKRWWVQNKGKYP
jgi:hypothetical protein